MPKEKSAVFCRFLSLCPQFDPYLLGGCDGGGAVHKKGRTEIGGISMRPNESFERVERLSHLFELLHLRENEDEGE